MPVRNLFVACILATLPLVFPSFINRTRKA